jgi:hypothetical protein
MRDLARPGYASDRELVEVMGDGRSPSFWRGAQMARSVYMAIVIGAIGALFLMQLVVANAMAAAGS